MTLLERSNVGMDNTKHLAVFGFWLAINASLSAYAVITTSRSMRRGTRATRP